MSPDADGAGTATKQVVSSDGTKIGFEVVGEGPPLVVVHGAAADRTQWTPVKELLARSFTVHLVDRRGRGLSADEQSPYSLERDAGDIAAVASAIGEPPFAFGHAYGGLCALEAALHGAEFRALLVDESPAGRPGAPMMPADLADGMAAALESQGKDGALEFFLRNIVGLQDEQIEGVRGSEMWETRKEVVHTVPREAAAEHAYERDDERLAGLDMPVRLVVGQESTAAMREAMSALHAAIPHSELVDLEDRLFTTMYSDPEVVARQLEDYFLG